MAKVKDLTGERFGRLVVQQLAYMHKKFGACWTCLCDCGNTKNVLAMSLKQGATKSCGCLFKETRGKASKADTAYNRIFYVYKRSAAIRNISFELDYNAVVELVQKECYYCGVVGSNTKGSETRPMGTSKLLAYNGIDRIDNTLGYSISNVVTCCKNCNRAKSDMTHNEYIEHCRRVASRFAP